MSSLRPVAAARAVLALALAGLLGFLLLARKPWSLADGGAFYGPVERSLGDAVVAGLWWAALVNALLCGLLLATAALRNALARPPREIGRASCRERV